MLDFIAKSENGGLKKIDGRKFQFLSSQGNGK
jgi:hypothetical protein